VPRGLLAVAVALVTLAGCPRAEPRRVRIVLSLAGAASRPVHGLDLTVALPEGARVAHDPSTRRLSSQALTLLDGASGATIDGHFSAHRTTPSIRILLASRVPIRDGEVAAIEVTVTSVAPPPRSRYEVASSAVTGPDGAYVTGASGWVSAVEPR
jgi:hypothetical protein